MEVFQMTIKDDIKAINKDIAKNKETKKANDKANYWLIKLINIYPDHNFVILYTDNHAYKIVASVKGVI